MAFLKQSFVSEITAQGARRKETAFLFDENPVTKKVYANLRKSRMKVSLPSQKNACDHMRIELER